MYDNYNYPLGADTSDAPWNEQEIPKETFSITVSQSLSKNVNVTTDNYLIYKDLGGVHYDTGDTDWQSIYKEDYHYTPLQLIGMFKRYLQDNLSKGIVFKSPQYTFNLIKECDNWEEDDVEYVEN